MGTSTGLQQFAITPAVAVGLKLIGRGLNTQVLFQAPYLFNSFAIGCSKAQGRARPNV
jgi:hypothetical protein